VRDLGGCRSTHQSVIDPAVGVDRIARSGEVIQAGEPLCRVHAATASQASAAAARLRAAFELVDGPGVAGIQR